MLFTDIDILDENLDYQAHQWVGVKDGTIDYIGDAAPENAADYGETYDGRGRLLMPALYNAHTHLPMTLLRGYAENVPLQEWLNNLVWPFEGKMTPEDTTGRPSSPLPRWRATARSARRTCTMPPTSACRRWARPI